MKKKLTAQCCRESFLESFCGSTEKTIRCCCFCCAYYDLFYYFTILGDSLCRAFDLIINCAIPSRVNMSIQLTISTQTDDEKGCTSLKLFNSNLLIASNQKKILCRRINRESLKQCLQICYSQSIVFQFSRPIGLVLR